MERSNDNTSYWFQSVHTIYMVQYHTLSPYMLTIMDRLHFANIVITYTSDKINNNNMK